MAPFFDRPPRAVRQCAAADQAPRPRIWRAELNESRRLLLLGDEQMPTGSSTIPSPRDPFGSDHARAISPRPSTARSIDATTLNASGSMSSTRGGVSWSSKTRPGPSAQTASIWGSCLGSIEPETFAMSPVCQSIRTPIAARQRKPGDLPHPVADRNQMHPTVSAATQTNAGDLVERHVDHAAHLQPVAVRLTVFHHGSGSLQTSRRTYNQKSCARSGRRCDHTWPADRDFFAIRSDPRSLAALFERVGELDGIVCTGGAARYKPWDQLTDEDWTFSLANKMMGQVNVVRYGVKSVRPGGAITLTTRWARAAQRGQGCRRRQRTRRRP